MSTTTERPIVWPGEIPDDRDILAGWVSGMISDGLLAQAVLGSDTVADGFACAPTAPASLSLTVAPGVLWQLAAVDNTAYGSMPADTAHAVSKSFWLADAATLAFTPPTTPGYTQNFLIQAGGAESDTEATVLPYYNADNPDSPFSGPGGSGEAQPTRRRRTVSLQVLAGAAAPSGSQMTPAPTSGFAPLWIVSVANGATALTSANVAMHPSAPFVGPKLRARAPLESPALTGTPTAPTPPAADSSTRLATTAFVHDTLGSATSGGFSVPIGGIIMWSGTSVPAYYHLCDGSGGTPDLRDRFIVGSGGSYGVGTTGGSIAQGGTTDAQGGHAHGGATKGHALTEAEMPSHSHSASADTQGDHTHPVGTWPVNGSGSLVGGSNNADQSGHGMGHTETAGAHGHNVSVGWTGGNQTHGHDLWPDGTHAHNVSIPDARPPFYALAFIMRVS
ncbi:Tail fiber protein (plasmid) [Rhodovastum atsumiense]|uniref:Tail fiber protein n=1 Tax=Rhodovastum atsumiense TaxID=504468 RepID=A0A5M6IU97_9PROT|nr:phage tail protein [Rhodovastum atsumiense]KAA5611890.1 tail fiber protein [Rhodovastum atsumiense]CAH2606131.1 Tail fiber protein [Rhodovastum atsumiense]